MVKKLQYPLQNYNYYDNLPVKPGVFIYKALVESKYPLKQLKVNIPETLCVFNGLYWITKSKQHMPLLLTHCYARPEWEAGGEEQRLPA